MTSEKFYGILDGALDTMNGQICLDEMLHIRTDICNILLNKRAPNAQFTIVPIAHIGCYEKLAVGKEILYGLCQKKKERADISTHSAIGMKVEELDILVVIKPILKPLFLVVDMSSHWTIGHVEMSFLENIEKSTP
jgi:hypothetical protein